MVEIMIPDRIKTSRPGNFQPLLTLPFLPDRPKICVATTVLAYISRTKDIRAKEKRFFVTVKRPHRSASSQTLARWIKSCLSQAGIDTKLFSAYSTKHATTSAAVLKGVDIDTIRQTAGWSKKSNVFARFYNRPVLPDRTSFAKSILETNKRRINIKK